MDFSRCIPAQFIKISRLKKKEKKKEFLRAKIAVCLLSTSPVMFDKLFHSFRSVLTGFSFNWIYLNRTCTRILLIRLNTRDMVLFFHTFSDSGFHIKRVFVFFVFLHSHLLQVTFHTFQKGDFSLTLSHHPYKHVHELTLQN